MDGEVESVSLACLISRSEQYDSSVRDYLKAKVFLELPPNTSELRTDIPHVMSIITEEARQKVFQAIENRLCLYFAEMGVVLEVS